MSKTMYRKRCMPLKSDKKDTADCLVKGFMGGKLLSSCHILLRLASCDSSITIK